jgi:hypothetical protein
MGNEQILQYISENLKFSTIQPAFFNNFPKIHFSAEYAGQFVQRVKQTPKYDEITLFLIILQD